MEEEIKLLPGYYLKGSDQSNVAVCSLLNEVKDDFYFSPDKVCLAGTLMTENIGIARILYNILLKPNIRYLILCGKEVNGHLPADALNHLYYDGVEIKKNKILIKGTKAYNPELPIEKDSIDEVLIRFREQITLVDLVGEIDINIINETIEECLKQKDGLYSKGPYQIRLKTNGKGEKPLTGGISIYKRLKLEDCFISSDRR